MLKFFRHIRQDLIHSGKTSKYFKYAIGEVILVVIGILIALQVNNWNEQRKIKEQQNTFLKSVKKDLNTDATFLKRYLKKLELDNNKLKEQSNRINEVSYNIDSLIDYAKNHIDVSMTPFGGFSNNTYESTKASGNVEIIDDPLKQELFELSVLQEKVQEEYISFRNSYYDEIEAISEKYTVPVSFSFIKKGSINDIIWTNIDEKDLAQRLNSWGTSKANFYRIIIANFHRTLEKTESILSLME